MATALPYQPRGGVRPLALLLLREPVDLAPSQVSLFGPADRSEWPQISTDLKVICGPCTASYGLSDNILPSQRRCGVFKTMESLADFFFIRFSVFYSLLLDLRLLHFLFSSLFITLGRSRFAKTPTLHLPRAERAGSLPKLPRRRRAGRARTLPLPRAERAGSLHELPPSRPWQENTDSEIAQSGASGFASQAAADQQNTNSTLAKSGGSGIAYYYYLLDFSYYVLNFSFKISAATTSYFIY